MNDESTAGRKFAQVVAAAWKIFIEHGFQAASMDAIALEAAVSKATLYAYFPSKQVLFESLIIDECRRVSTIVMMPDLGQGIVEALRSFAVQYVRMFVEHDPHRMAFFRVLVPEVTRFPDLAQLLLDCGPKADVERLARLMDEARERGLVDIADPPVAAAQFLALIRGELPIQAALGLPAPSDAEVHKTIEDGLALFLKACATSREDDSSKPLEGGQRGSDP